MRERLPDDLRAIGILFIGAGVTCLTFVLGGLGMGIELTGFPVKLLLMGLGAVAVGGICFALARKLQSSKG
jgi:hypothetical protein